MLPARSLRWMFSLVLVVVLGLWAPPALQGEQGQPVEVSGVLQVAVADDFAGHRSFRVYLLQNDTTGKIWQLDLATNARPQLEPGVRLRVRGLGTGSRIAVEPAGMTVLGHPTAAASLVAGAKKLVVLIADFLDATNQCPRSQVADYAFTGTGSTDRFYRETSFGQLSFPGDTDGNGQPDVFGPYVINAHLADPCALGPWADLTEAAATAAGVNLSLYDYKMYVLPTLTTCNIGGAATIGCQGAPCRSWNLSCGSQLVYAHELGHNLTMNHASADLDADGVIEDEYGDESDVMGNYWVQQNAPHKVQMGWLPPAQVLDVTQSGVYHLAPTEITPAASPFPQALRVFNLYYLSTRRLSGFDSPLDGPFGDHTSLHRYSGWEPHCIGDPPRTFPCSGRTAFLGLFGDAQSFTDAENGFSFTQLGHDSGGVLVQINLQAPPGRDFYTLPPCRVLDTRLTTPLASGTPELFTFAGSCGIPASAKALSVNVTAIGGTGGGNVAVVPGNLTVSGTSTLNFGPGQTRANNALVRLAADGTQTVRALPFVQGEGTVHLLIDVNGYFQ